MIQRLPTNGFDNWPCGKLSEYLLRYSTPALVVGVKGGLGVRAPDSPFFGHLDPSMRSLVYCHLRSQVIKSVDS